MIEAVDEQEKKQLWEVYQEANDEGKEKMFVMANSFLNIQLLSEGKKEFITKTKKGKRGNIIF